MRGDVEKGVFVDEKKDVVVEDEVVGADMEKTGLLVDVEGKGAGNV
jgi:hypothetical protein